ncbi:MAG: S-layer homology domain-containing protein [Oscillospiraceae bacterium]
MKKRLIAALLCLLLLGGAGTATAAGGADDPLISLSYINNIYLPEFTNHVRDSVAAAMTARTEDSTRTEGGTVSVSAGGSVSLRTGQTLVLLSGSARLSVSAGSVVDATLGSVAKSGSLSLYHRYIVCEDSAVTVSVLTDASLSVSTGASVTQGDGKVSPFKDVTREDWFFSDVVNAYERGLVNGMTASTYVPGGELTVAQAVKLAACMHQLYHSGAVTLENSSQGQWYDSYVAYARTNGILSGDFADYNAAITRRDFVELFYKALPATEYTAINSIPDGAIPDVAMSDPAARQIYAFYRAGILTGYEDHSFGADSTIVRSEVATILNRMFDSTARRSFTIE